MQIKFLSKIITATLVNFVIFIAAHSSPVTGQGTWEKTLLGRDINRNAVEATSVNAVYLYDTTINVTWLRDANINGEKDWYRANSWAANLVTGNGVNAINDWRLPSFSSEMASLYFTTLGNKAAYDKNGVRQPGQLVPNTGSFLNFMTGLYWLIDKSETNEYSYFAFNTFYGSKNTFNMSDNYYAMAVRTGDVLVSSEPVISVPEPKTHVMLLFGLSLMCMVILSKHKILARLDRHR